MVSTKPCVGPVDALVTREAEPAHDKLFQMCLAVPECPADSPGDRRWSDADGRWVLWRRALDVDAHSSSGIWWRGRTSAARRGA